MDTKVSIKEIRENQNEKDFNKKISKNSPWKNMNLVLPRTFRWTLSCQEYPDIQWWMKKLKTDYLNKIIEIEVYEDKDAIVFNWIQSTINNSPSKNKIYLNHLDDIGNSIYCLEFLGLKITEHMALYDYSNSDVLSHFLKVKFEKVVRTAKS